MGLLDAPYMRAFYNIKVLKELVRFCNVHVWASCFKGEQLGLFSTISLRAF